MAAFATRGLHFDVLRTVLAEHELLLSGTVVEELRRTLVEKIRFYRCQPSRYSLRT